MTGGLGFIGSNVSIELLQAGYEVLIIDSLINSFQQRLKNIESIIYSNKIYKNSKIHFRQADISNRKLLNSIFYEFNKRDNPIKAVIHCAGLKSVGESVVDPLRYWDANINATLTLISIMKIHNCHNLVFSSSASIYKRNNGEKVTEESPLQAENPYGNTKLAIEKILEDLYNSQPNLWRIANLRYFNPAGTNENGFLGDIPKLQPKNLFPLILQVANKKLDHLSIFGKDWPTKDGTCIRDYIHIRDLSKAHLATLEFLLENPPKILSLNIGTGNGSSVLEVLNTFMKVNKINIPYKFKSRRKGDTPYLVACNDLALKLIKWSPEYDLEDICLDSFKGLKNK